MHNRRFSIGLVVIISAVVGISAGISSLPSAHAALPNPIVWTTKAPLPYTIAQAGVISGLDGRIYVMGGYSGGSGVTSASAYDPRTNSWSTLASLPVSVRGAGIAVDKSGLIYVISGCCAATTNNQIYNTTSNTWTTGTPISYTV